jgi:Fe-S cluster biogenesis protein NfuA
MTKLENKILEALNEIRPYLVQDGGDISLSSISGKKSQGKTSWCLC